MGQLRPIDDKKIARNDLMLLVIVMCPKYFPKWDSNVPSGGEARTLSEGTEEKKGEEDEALFSLARDAA